MTSRPPEPRLALVTGGSRGLGATLAHFLAAQGFDLLLTARNSDVLGDAARSLAGFGTRIRTIAGDVSDPQHRERLRAAVAERDRLDLLVNNASELGPSPLPRLSHYPLADLERVYRINVIAPIALTQLLLPYLSRAHGMIVNVSSDAALGGYPGWGGYGASKAALDLVTATFAHELREDGVAVVGVDPGDLRTAMHQAAFPGEDISDRPSPDVTLPFWGWLFHQTPTSVSGQRFRAQADRWEIPA
jgi:NAD(P)-dependent dehydrogenase (short-subunit alcohol dehydrogenase family)